MCNMQNATCPSQSTPSLPHPPPLLPCHCCGLCCAVHLLQTLILFMLQCSEVNNFIYPLPEARTMRGSLQLHSALAAGCLPLKLQLRMTHDTCLGCEKLFHLLPCQDLLKAMASSADWIVRQREREGAATDTEREREGAGKVDLVERWLSLMKLTFIFCLLLMAK